MSSTQEVGEIFGSGSGPAHAMLRSPTVLIASVGLWGMNVYFFKLFGIDYARVLRYDLDEEKRRAEELLYGGGGNGIGAAGSGVLGGKATASSSSSSAAAATVVSSRHSKNNSLSLSSSEAGGAGAAIAAPHGHAEMYGDDQDDGSDEDYYYYQDDGQESSPLFDHRGAVGGPDPLLSSSSITWGRLVGFSLGLLVLLHATYGFWIDVLGRSPLSAVFAFYGAVTTAVVLPLPSTRWLRRAVVIVLQRSFELVNPRCNCVLLDAAAASSNPHNPQQLPVLPRAIPFVDVFFADAMCSLSKVFFDWGMLLHMAAHYPKPVPPSALNIVIPSAFAAVPFVIRARQCLVMYQIGRLTSQPNRFSHLANAVKYGTSIFPLVVSAYQKTVSAASSARLEPLLVLLLVINALYALYWDVVMDWGLLQNPAAVCRAAAAATAAYPAAYPSSSSLAAPGPAPGASSSSSSSAADALTNRALASSSSLPASASLGAPASSSAGAASSASAMSGSKHHAAHHHLALRQAAGAAPLCHHLMRPKLRFGVAMSALIVLADSVLRFSWTLRFYHAIFPSGDSFVLCTQFLEVFRRALWNLLRIEWEHMRQRVRQRQSLLAIKKKEGSRGVGGGEDSSSLLMVSLGGVGSNGEGGGAAPSGSHHGSSGGGATGAGAPGAAGGGGAGIAAAAAASERASFLLHPGKRPKEATA